MQNELITQLGDEINSERNELLKGDHSLPDYGAIRDRILHKLKMGRQSAAGKALDAFIKELEE